jgi:predicted house-cleaning noncanonical NTP pyrophosphatase (MazG superfamily)
MMHKLKYKGQEEIGEMIGYWYGEELKDIEVIKNLPILSFLFLYIKKD